MFLQNFDAIRADFEDLRLYSRADHGIVWTRPATAGFLTSEEAPLQAEITSI